MNGISHKQAMKWIDRRQDGLLKENQQSLLDDHLRSCDSCRSYAEEMEQLASRLTDEFQTRWEDDPGPSQNIVANVRAKAKSIPAGKRFSSGFQLAGGVTVLIILGIVINFFVSQLQDSAPVANGTEAVSSFPAAEDRLLAFASMQGGNSDIYTMHADGSGLTNITNNPGFDGFPHWSPDGRQIAFESDRDGSYQIYLMDADGSNVTQLTQGGDANGFLGGDIQSPWSPDGRKLIFSQNITNDEKHQFYVLDVATKSTVPLTKETGKYYSPSWSPDGKYIAFTSDESSGTQRMIFQLYIADSQGTQLTNLTAGLSEYENLSLIDYYWSLDGTSITFVTNPKGGRSSSIIYKAGLDGSLVSIASTNQQILDWWNGIALQTDVPQKVEENSWSLLRADGSKTLIQTCQSNDLPLAYALKRSTDGTLAFGIRCPSGGWTLSGANPDGTAINQLLNSPLDAKYDSLFNMTWSPDDHFLAFMALDEEHYEYTDMFVVNAKDPSQQPLKMEKSSSPSWQPVASENLVKEKSPVNLAIDPQSCKPAEGESVPGELDGYDVIQNASLTDGDFTYDFWLYCDPALKPDDSEHQSAIAGLGIYSSWRYNGPQVDGGYRFHYEFDPGEPFGETGTDGPLYKASAKEKDGIYLSESRIQETIQQGLPIQFSIVVDSSLGQDGAVLSFALEPTENGVRIADARTDHIGNIAGDRVIAFTAIGDNGNPDIFTAHPDGNGLANLTNTPDQESGLAWSPDGTRLAYVSGQDGNASILVMDADGSNLRTLTKDPGLYGRLLWSPDGTKIAYALQAPDGKTADIYVLESNGQNRRRLTDRHPLPDYAGVGVEEWSPDSRYIYYMDYLAPGQSYIIQLDVESGKSTNMTGKMFYLPYYMTVNQDGSITYLVDCTENPMDFCLQAKSINQDGIGEQTHETMQIQQVCSSKWGVSSFYFGADWFFDRSKIVFAFACRDGVHLYIANADGSDLKPLTNQPVFYKDMGLNRSSFELLPDGQSIVFLAPLDVDQAKGLYALDVQDALQNPNLVPTRLNVSASQLGGVAWQPVASTEPVTKELAPVPGSIEEVQALAGFEILLPTYLPKVYSFDRAAYDPQTREAILNFVSSAADANKMGTLIIREGRGDLPQNSELPVVATPVPLAGATGSYSDGAWIYDSAGITTPRWVQGQGNSLRWQKNGMSFTIDFIGGELTPPVGLDELTAIANSMESHSLPIQQTPTPEPVEASSNNALVAFTSGPIGDQDIYTMRADGSQLTNLTSNSADDYGSLWSPDGQKILFQSERTGNRDIFVMDADGSNVTQLTDNPGTDSLDAWSPDGRKILYETAGKDINDAAQLVVMDADGNHKTVLNEPGSYLFLGWSPDGRKIVYLQQNTETEQPQDDLVVVMNTDGTGRLEWNFIVDRIKWVDNRHFIGDGWNGQAESPDLGWVLHRFSTDGEPPVEVASHSSRIVEILKDTHVVAGGSILAWYTSDGSPAPFTSWNSSEVCRGTGDQFLPANWTSTAPDESKALIVIPCQSGKTWFYINPLDGSPVRKLTDFSLDGNEGGGPVWSWSPDGKYGIMTIGDPNGGQGADFYLFNVEQMLRDPSVQPVRITSDHAMKNGVAWQPAP